MCVGSIYRAFYTVGMSLIVMVFLDFVWVEPPATISDNLRRAEVGQGGGGGGPGGEETDEGHFFRIMLATGLAFFVIIATIVQSNTETYIRINSKCGLTGKQLRDWIVAQLMWADDGRLAMMRHADYLNAATSEVESVATCYEAIFPAIEKCFHFVLNLLLVIIYVDIPAGAPIAVFLILSLLPITLVVHWKRAHTTRQMLEKRIICERTYVSSLADIIENTATFRGLGASNVRKAFANDTEAYAKTHLAAVLYTVLTKERIELAQASLPLPPFFSSPPAGCPASSCLCSFRSLDVTCGVAGSDSRRHLCLHGLSGQRRSHESGCCRGTHQRLHHRH
jgi:hypothetical protein